MASISTPNEPPAEGHPFLCAPQEPVANKRAKGPLAISFQNEAKGIAEEDIARCIYANGLSFNVCSPYWQKMVRSINEAPKGFKVRSLGYEKVDKTHFASNTIVLRRLVKVKEALSRMVISADWSIWRQSNSAKAAAIKGMILDHSGWDCVEYLLRFTEPLLSMIQYTDMDRTCLGEVYDGIDSMIEDIKNIINDREQDPEEKFFKELQIIMVERWNKMTTPFHLLAFALSPRFYSQSILRVSTTRVAPYRDPEVAQGYKAAL